MMHAFDSDEMPPPSPSSCRPYGSGLPSAARRIASRAGSGQVPLVEDEAAAGAAAHVDGADLLPLAHPVTGGPRVREQAAGQEDVALAWREHAARRERGARARRWSTRTAPAGQRGAEPLDAQAVVALDGVVGRRVVEDERHHAPVDEVRAVDPRERLRDHRAHAEVHRRRSRPPRARSPGRRSRRPR